LPEESLSLGKKVIGLNYGTHKTVITDKDLSVPGQLKRFSKNGAQLYYSPLPVEANEQRGSVYIAFNESVEDHRVQVRDLKFGFKAVLDVPAGRAVLVVFDSKGKKLVGYETPDF
jgi:hypothetical protein